MINISNTIKEACNSDKLTYREYVVLTGTTAQIDVATEMYATAYKDTHFIGTFNMKYIKFTTSNDVQYRNKELIFYKEVNGESFKIGNFIVTEIKDNDSNEEVTVTAYDYALKFAEPYTTSLNYESGEITLKNVLDEICSNVGVELVNQTITNGDFIVDSNQFVSGELYGDVVSAIAFITGDFATITENNQLELIFNKPTDEIIEDYVDLEDKRDTQPITSVSIGVSNIDGENIVLKDDNLIQQYGEHWLVINDVPFAYTQAKRQQLIQAIFDKVKGFGYSAFKSEYSFKPYLTLGDLIQFRNKEGQLVNSIVLRITSKYDNIILEALSVTKATVEYENPLNALQLSKRTELIVNKQNQTIEAIVEDVDEQNAKISSLRIDVDEIRGEISDIADVTVTSETTNAYLEFENINVSEPISITIYPTNEDISNLLITNNMFISNNLELKHRTLDFHNITTDEHFTWKLPNDLWFLNDTYDELHLNYEGLVCEIVKRIGINSNGEKYILDNEIIQTYSYPSIPLTEGDYQIRLLNYDNAYIFMRLMSKNIYTSQFATKVEVNSTISQTAQEINLEVSKKVGNDEVISKINQTAEQITINANKINIGGVITAINNNTTTTIDGDKITTGTITANQVASDVITTKNFNAQNINANKITSGTLSTDRLESDVITTSNFSAQNINANKITSGTLSTNRLESKVITTDNFQAQNINANKITSGTLNGTNVNITNLNASNITSGTLSANRVSGGTLSGASIDVYSGTGFFRYMSSQSIHPFVSALNMAYGTGNGISFRSSDNRSNLGNALGHLSVGNAQLLLEAYSGSNRNMYVSGPSLSIVTNSGTRNNTGDYEGSIYIYSSASISLNARNGNVYAGSGTSGTNQRIAVDSSGPSSRILKENITDFNDYESALRLLKNIKLYNYNYKYKLHDKKDQYGFIIDDLLEDEDAKKFLYFKDDKAIPDKNGYFDYQKAEEEPDNENIIYFKRYDEEILVKYLLTTNKALLQRIEKLEKEMEELKNEKN